MEGWLEGSSDQGEQDCGYGFTFEVCLAVCVSRADSRHWQRESEGRRRAGDPHRLARTPDTHILVE